MSPTAPATAIESSQSVALKVSIITAAVQQLNEEVELYRNRLQELRPPIDNLDNPTSQADGHLSDANDESGLMDSQLATADADLVRLQQPEFQAMYDRVVPGAVVHLANGLKLLIGVNLRPFDVNGNEYRSLTEGAPLYPLLHGKRTGDSIDYNGRALGIDQIL